MLQAEAQRKRAVAEKAAAVGIDRGHERDPSGAIP
jgi:hypothetical protein